MRLGFGCATVLSVKYKPDWGRVSSSQGYNCVYCPDHPRAWSTGYVYVHVLVAEMKLGRLLRPGEVVHHKDRNKTNNAPENVDVLPSHSAHGLLHRADIKASVVVLCCGFCGRSFERPKRRVVPGLPVFCSKACAGRRRPDKPERHGTSNWYSYHKCRCDLCRKAQTLRTRKWRSRSP